MFKRYQTLMALKQTLLDPGHGQGPTGKSSRKPKKKQTKGVTGKAKQQDPLRPEKNKLMGMTFAKVFCGLPKENQR